MTRINLVTGYWLLVTGSWRDGQRAVASNQSPGNGSSPGMILSMHLPKVLPVHVRVDLRRRDIGVAEHFLYGAQVGASLQQVRGKRVTKGVRRDRLLDTGALHVAP